MASLPQSVTKTSVGKSYLILKICYQITDFQIYLSVSHKFLIKNWEEQLFKLKLLSKRLLIMILLIFLLANQVSNSRCQESSSNFCVYTFNVYCISFPAGSLISKNTQWSNYKYVFWKSKQAKTNKTFTFLNKYFQIWTRYLLLIVKNDIHFRAVSWL
jgi:hypothetical protein